jgi:hypothetical protein
MTVGSGSMFVGKLAMFESRSGVLLRLFVLAEIVMMGRLMVMMRSGMVVSGRLVVMLARRMLWCRSLQSPRPSRARLTKEMLVSVTQIPTKNIASLSLRTLGRNRCLKRTVSS